MKILKWFSIGEIIVVLLLTLMEYLYFYRILPLSWRDLAFLIIINFILVKIFVGLYKLIKRWREKSQK